jgi:hypothetical protein
MNLQLVARTGQPDFLDLPWDVPLEEWDNELVVEIEPGIHRHVVRFVEHDGAFFAVKELPSRLAEREYRLLRRLEDEEVPAVRPVGIVTERRTADGDDLEAALITRYLDYSLPYRLVLRRRVLPAPRPLLLDAFAQLLVRLHLAGFFWGDCSLSNTLFRRDAGVLSASLVDAETGELHDQLSDGQRLHDLEIAEENVVGELYDLAAELEREIPEPEAVGAEVRQRYELLWSELTADEVFGVDESDRLEARLHRLNELGFDVEEVEVLTTPNGYRLRLPSTVVEPGHHRRRLLALTGLRAEENQARRLLNDIAAYRAQLELQGEPVVSEAAAAGRWLAEVFEPAIAAVPPDVARDKRAAAELYHELLEHRWFLSEREGRDVGLDAAIDSYVENVLKPAPDERAALLEDE